MNPANYILLNIYWLQFRNLDSSPGVMGSCSRLMSSVSSMQPSSPGQISEAEGRSASTKT